LVKPSDWEEFLTCDSQLPVCKQIILVYFMISFDKNNAKILGFNPRLSSESKNVG